MVRSALDGVRAITFDMYGTLLDLEASFVRGIGRFIRARGSTSDPAQLVQYWEASYLMESMADTILGGGRTPFERLRRDCFSQVLSQAGVSHTAEDVDYLLGSGAETSLFPDVREGLSALRDRYTLAVLSNGDLDSLKRMVAGLSVPVDQVVSAEQAGVYKPHPAVYRRAVERLGLREEQILHVAAHTWDIRGAKACGLAVAYLDRNGAPFSAAPVSADLKVSNLTDLAERLAKN